MALASDPNVHPLLIHCHVSDLRQLSSTATKPPPSSPTTSPPSNGSSTTWSSASSSGRTGVFAMNHMSFTALRSRHDITHGDHMKLSFLS
ncbi:MAG: hypothetical protein MZV63_06820 [Marinilabiliales bacterium]|nr:hypothetical protein [Marinilabiliales bacterium]